jgi:hypothetical protein
MNFRFHPEAETEFVAAIDWYEARSAGLGADFAAEIHAACPRCHAPAPRTGLLAATLVMSRWRADIPHFSFEQVAA